MIEGHEEQLDVVARRLDALNALGTKLGEARDEQACYRIVAEACKELFGVPRCTVAVPDDHAPTFQVLTLEGTGRVLTEGTRMIIIGTAVGAAVDDRCVVSTVTHEGPYSDWEHLNTIGLTQFICAPLLIMGEALGTLNIGSPPEPAFTKLDVHVVERAAAMLASHVKLRRALS